MEKEPLISYLSPRKPQPSPPLVLCSLPEHDELSIPHLPITPSFLKDRLIFGPTPPSPKDSSSCIVDALTLSLNSPKTTYTFNSTDFTSNADQLNQFSQQAWLIDPNYEWHKSNLHRSKIAPAMAVINDFYQPKADKPQFGNFSSIVKQAFVLLIIYLSLGSVIYSFNRKHFKATETQPVVDALHFCIN